MISSLSTKRFYDYYFIALVCSGWFVQAAFLNHVGVVVDCTNNNNLPPSLFQKNNKCSSSRSNRMAVVSSWMTTSKQNENENPSSSSEQMEIPFGDNVTDLMDDDVTHNDTTTADTTNDNTTTVVPFSEERPIMVTGNQEVLGIGGTNGLRPDVSKLKRNLVQESVQKYKKEVLMLLGGGGGGFLFPLSKQQKQKRKTIMEEKIAALLDVNPVTTTTDSNILDGDWEFTLAIESTPIIRESLRFALKNPYTTTTKQRKQATKTSSLGSPFRFKKQQTYENVFRESKRHINLENLQDDEDPYILDSTSYYNGLLRVDTLYKVVGLSRTSVELAVTSMTKYIFDKEIRRKGTDKFAGLTVTIQFLYLDTDFCIATSSNEGLDGSLHVYTKSNVYRSRRKVRQLTSMWRGLTKIKIPFRQLLQRRQNIDATTTMKEKNDSKLSESEKSILLKRIYNGETDESWTVLRLGDLLNDSSDDSLAWSGEEDPFIHLSATERQELLRSMSIQEIEAARKAQQAIAAKKKRETMKSQKKFRKPGA